MVHSLSMGQNISKPLQGEKNVDFMVRIDKGYWTQPFVDNLARWSETPDCKLTNIRDSDLLKKMIWN